METAINSNSVVSVEAIVYPECTCGEPWTLHGLCGGYVPSKPVVNYGTMFFKSPDFIANTLFKLEQFLQRLRVARLRRI
jgi:hypothetical protein